MFIRAGNSIINTDNVVEIKVFPARPERTYYDEEIGRESTAPRSPLELWIYTTATAGEEIGYDDIQGVRPTPYEIILRGDEAEEFMRTLPVGPAPGLTCAPEPMANYSREREDRINEYEMWGERGRSNH